MNEMTAQLERIMPTALHGSVAEVAGPTIAALDFPAPVGAVVEVRRHAGAMLRAEVVGFRDKMSLLYPLGDPAGVRRGDRVRLARTARWLGVGPELLGRVINAEGRAIDGLPQPAANRRAPIDRPPPPACRRPRIDQPLCTGVRAIDGPLTCGKGQRMGIFSAAGVGKSVLLGMMARHSAADVIVVGLIGERGREVNDFIHRDLGPEGLKKSVVVVATGDEPAVMRVRAAAVATAVAEYFRDQGRDVLLLMDSITRLALAQREIGLAAGETPATRGFTPSVFTLLPKLVERAGRSHQGSITAFYAVLVEGDDPAEPISDALRGLLDGHIWLSRKLASRGHWPAIDLLESVSRLSPEVIDDGQRAAAAALREMLAAYRDHEDLISIGAYRPGTSAAVDAAIQRREAIEQYLRQSVDRPSTMSEARQGLLELAKGIGA
jgi:flagellum-specific ATP synthase